MPLAQSVASFVSLNYNYCPFCANICVIVKQFFAFAFDV